MRGSNDGVQEEQERKRWKGPIRKETVLQFDMTKEK